MFIPRSCWRFWRLPLRLTFGTALRFARRTAVGLCSDLIAMALLTTSPLLIGTPGAFVLLCVLTGALGLGFGATVMALNTLVEGFFPNSADGAVLVLNALLGVGTALAPLLVALFTGLGAWWALPLLMVLLIALLLVGTLQAPLRCLTVPLIPLAGYQVASGCMPRTVLLTALSKRCVATGLLYLSIERDVRAQEASFALTASGDGHVGTPDRCLPRPLCRRTLALFGAADLAGHCFSVVVARAHAGIRIANFAAAGWPARRSLVQHQFRRRQFRVRRR
jgi:MFS family permease